MVKENIDLETALSLQLEALEKLIIYCNITKVEAWSKNGKITVTWKEGKKD